MCDVMALLGAVERLHRAGEPFLVATVVQVTGSSYRRPGARMLLSRDRWVAGSVSGGCLEADVMKRGWWRTRDGAALVKYDATAQDAAQEEVRWGLGLGCDGVVNVLLERAQDGGVDPFAFFERCFREQKRGALATVFRSDATGVAVGARVAWSRDGVEADPIDPWARDELARACAVTFGSGKVTTVMLGRPDGSFEALVEPVRPPPRLFVCGAGHDAVPVAQMASTIGWEVIVCEPTARFATRERFRHANSVLGITPSALVGQIDAADCALAVLMGHDYEADRTYLDALLRSGARYIGVLGPRRRTARMLDEIGGVRSDPRVHAPVGLALGAETPQEIALAIVAEAQSVMAGAPATSLRELPGPIHTPDRVL
ncbi:MAG: XdhC family protein [Polyangiaceae bacterium]|jgi:xanthine/CO dehydrogenase XdhC/CoxF family maturation factor